jgi:FkbM family methyltransferase
MGNINSVPASPLRRLITILAQQRHPFRFLASRLLKLSGLSHFFAIRREGYTLSFFPTSLSAAFWINPLDRSDEERFLRHCLKPGDTAIDVGANIGSISLAMASAVGRTGQVMAIEPHPKLFVYLQANIRRNRADQIRAVHCALGAEKGEAFISDRRSDDQNRIGGEGIAVPLCPLDDIAPAGQISLLKLDVEGYEYFVLAGGEKTLLRTAMVYLECIVALAVPYGANATQPWRLLADSGFELFERADDRLCPAKLPPRAKMMLIALKNPATFTERTGILIGQPNNEKHLD